MVAERDPALDHIDPDLWNEIERLRKVLSNQNPAWEAPAKSVINGAVRRGLSVFAQELEGLKP